MRKFVWIILLIMALGHAGSAYACSCFEQTLPEAVQDAAAIFMGKVVKLEVVEVKDGISQIEAMVQRERSFKGEVPERVVLTSDGCCYCASWFEIARTYLFFASEFEGKLSTSSCSRTKLVGDAEDELQYLKQMGKQSWRDSDE